MKRHSSDLRKISDELKPNAKIPKVRSSGALLGIIIILMILLILTTIISFVLISKSNDTTVREPKKTDYSLQQVSGEYTSTRTQDSPSAVPAFPE